MRVRILRAEGVTLNGKPVAKDTEVAVDDALGALWCGKGWAEDAAARPKPASKPAADGKAGK